MITIGEEMLLLMLDYDTGWYNTRLPPHSRRNAVSGALLMDLALENRIDTDPQDLFVLDPTPSPGHPQAHVLARIVEEREPRPIAHWIGVFARDYQALHALLIAQLVQRRILIRQRSGRLWFMGIQHQVTDDGRPLRDVRRRIAGVLLSDEIPDPRDVMLISLTQACALWKGLLDEAGLARIEHRISQIAQMDFIGQAVARAIQEHEAG